MQEMNSKLVKGYLNYFWCFVSLCHTKNSHSHFIFKFHFARLSVFTPLLRGCWSFMYIEKVKIKFGSNTKYSYRRCLGLVSSMTNLPATTYVITEMNKWKRILQLSRNLRWTISTDVGFDGGDKQKCCLLRVPQKNHPQCRNYGKRSRIDVHKCWFSCGKLGAQWNDKQRAKQPAPTVSKIPVENKGGVAFSVAWVFLSGNPQESTHFIPGIELTLPPDSSLFFLFYLTFLYSVMVILVASRVYVKS